MTYRRVGVTTLAIIFIILAAIGLISGILLETVAVTASNNTILGDFLDSFYFLFIRTPQVSNLQNILLFDMYDIINQLSYISIYHFLTVVLLVFATLHIFASVGLLSMKRLGRYLALTAGILSIINAIIGFSLASIVGRIPLIFVILYPLSALILGIVVVVYLMGEVRYEFE